ncbi:MFS transporter [Pseudonocardia nematodicida]|uniref:MFS transporter n=1 Tax=Pseudonocardia nematodicida TaxID=1206997 RepID=A0ABV1K5X8_9PSEU
MAIPIERPTDRKESRRAGRAAFTGTLLEYYDFSLYAAAAATVFPRVFFPDASPALATLQSVATFSVAFLVRPVGGAILGSLGDRIGRKRVLVFTLVLMGVATTGIGLLPGHATIGWAAPMLLVLMRILQGIGASAEYGGATLVAVEFAPEKRRGLLGSLPGAGSAFGGVLGTLALLTASSTLSAEQFASWGWRVPFLLSGILVVYGIWLRATLPETPDFARAERSGRTSRTPLRDVLRRYPRAVVTVIVIVTAQTGLGYFYLVFMVSYAGSQLGFSQSETFTGLLVAQLSCGLLIPAFGALSDVVGRKPVVAFGMLVSAATAFPTFMLVQPGWPLGLWLAMFLGNGVGVAAIFAPVGTLVAEIFASQHRYSGMGLARETGNMIGAAVVPVLAVQLSFMGAGTTPLSLLLLGLAALGLVGVLAAPRPHAPAASPGGPPVSATSRPGG